MKKKKNHNKIQFKTKKKKKWKINHFATLNNVLANDQRPFHFIATSYLTIQLGIIVRLIKLYIIV